MKRTLFNITARFKKYAVFLILLPIFTGALSFFLTDENNENATRNNVFFADTTINLGEFNDPQLNEPNNVKDLISSTAFLEEVITENNLPVEVDDLKANMNLENVHDEMLIIYLTGDDQATVLETLGGITDRLLALSDERYTEWSELINQTIEDIEGTDVIAEETVDKKEFLFNLRQELFNSSKAELVEPVELANENVSVAESQGTSPLQRVVFGIVIGMMLSLFLLFLPEVFRD